MVGMKLTIRSRHLQPAHRRGCTSETVGFDAEAVEHADKNSTDGVIVLGVETEVLAVLKASSSEEKG
tara:strand:+ start:290 stop:490 length:201 start_codon:yes stop_codon:yes gene_type:complete